MQWIKFIAICWHYLFNHPLSTWHEKLNMLGRSHKILGATAAASVLTVMGNDGLATPLDALWRCAIFNLNLNVFPYRYTWSSSWCKERRIRHSWTHEAQILWGNPETGVQMKRTCQVSIATSATVPKKKKKNVRLLCGWYMRRFTFKSGVKPSQAGAGWYQHQRDDPFYSA